MQVLSLARKTVKASWKMKDFLTVSRLYGFLYTHSILSACALFFLCTHFHTTSMEIPPARHIGWFIITNHYKVKKYRITYCTFHNAKFSFTPWGCQMQGSLMGAILVPQHIGNAKRISLTWKSVLMWARRNLAVLTSVMLKSQAANNLLQKLTCLSARNWI